MEEHEVAFCTVFIRREKRRRYRDLLASPKRRREVLDLLNHGADIARSLARLVPAHQRSAADVELLLRARGAGTTCHVITDGLEIDGEKAPLRQALVEAEGHRFGVVLSCIPGQLAFYKEEAPGDWFLLERRPAT